MAGLEAEAETFGERGIRLVAVSSEEEDGARDMKDDEGLSFPVLFDADVDTMEERLGLYVHRNDRSYLQPAQFILDPEGIVRLASYSSERIGRVKGEEALDFVESLRG